MKHSRKDFPNGDLPDLGYDFDRWYNNDAKKKQRVGRENSMEP